MQMAQTATMEKSEWTGLAVAVGAHVALGIALYIAAQAEPAKVDLPDRMVVSLAEDVALESTAPDPGAEPQAVAPVLAPEPAPVSVPEPEPVIIPEPRPVPRPTQSARPQPRPTQSRTRPSPAPSPRQTQSRANPSPAPSPRQTQAARSGGGSRLGDDFLEGSGSNSKSTGTPAATFGAAEASSLNSLIGRQLKPHWASPQGPDAEKLVTIVRFRLDRDGKLQGSPTCVEQSGVTPTNEAQKSIHCENAIRAVRLASPFNIPANFDQFYDKWKTINSRFDRRL